MIAGADAASRSLAGQEQLTKYLVVGVATLVVLVAAVQYARAIQRYRRDAEGGLRPGERRLVRSQTLVMVMALGVMVLLGVGSVFSTRLRDAGAWIGEHAAVLVPVLGALTIAWTYRRIRLAARVTAERMFAPHSVLSASDDG